MKQTLTRALANGATVTYTVPLSRELLHTWSCGVSSKQLTAVANAIHEVCVLAV